MNANKKSVTIKQPPMRERVESSKEDFRNKMQSMHDKLKDSQQIESGLNGDTSIHPQSFKVLDVPSINNQQIELYPLEPYLSQNNSINKMSSTIITSIQHQHQPSKKFSFPNKQQQYPQINEECPQKNQENSNYVNNSRQESFQQSVNPDFGFSLQAIYSKKDGDQISQNQHSLLPKEIGSYVYKKSESSEESESSQSEQDIKQQQNDKISVKDKNQSSSLKQSYFEEKTNTRDKNISINQSHVKPSNYTLQRKKEQSQSKRFCFKIFKFFRLRKELNNFERGIQILDNMIKNQMNSATRVRQKVITFTQMLLHYKKSWKNELDEDDYKMIGDRSYQHGSGQNYKQNEMQLSFYVKYSSCLLKFAKKLFHLIAETVHITPFIPTDLPVVVWDVFQIILTYSFIFLYSIQVFFAQNLFSSPYMVECFKLILGLIFFDIILKFNTCYFEKDQIVQNRSKIALKYLTSIVFFTDIISLFSIFFKLKYKNGEVSYNPDNDIMIYIQNCLIFLLLNRLSEKRKRFDSIITLEEYQKHIFRLFTQVFSVMSVAHLASIAWYMLGIYEESKNYQITWLSKAGIQDLDYFEKYIYSIYWATTTMTTVGYGDISATNSTEALFISIMMIFFSTVFAYSVNNIGFILQEIEKSSKNLNDNLSIIQRYLNRKNVDISLKSRVRHYLNFLASESKNRDKEAEDDIIGVLSNKLRNEITEEINSKVLNRFHLFSSNFSSKMMKKIVFIMEEVLVSPNEIIFQEDDIGDQSIYFLQSGVVEIYSSKLTRKDGSCVVFQEISTNQLFGEISFFSGLSRKASARSVNLSTMYRIKRDTFLELIKTNEEDFERLKMMQEQIIFQKNLKCLYLQCYSCKQLGHLASQCTKTHINFDKQFIILKDNFSRFQERIKEFSRREKKINLNPKLYIKKNKIYAKRLKEELKDYNSKTILLFGGYNNGDDEDEVATVINGDEQITESSQSSEETKSGADKFNASRLLFFNSEKGQDNQRQKSVSSKGHRSNSEQEQSFDKQFYQDSVKSNRNIVSNFDNVLSQSSPQNEDVNKLDKQRWSQIDPLNYLPSPPKQQIQQQQQSMIADVNNQDYNTKQSIQINQPNFIGIGDENVIQKMHAQDMMNKHHSLQSLDFDIASSINFMGSKKNLDYTVNAVNIQGASQKDQRNYFSMINNNLQQKRTKEHIAAETDQDGLIGIPKNLVKRSSYNLQLNNDNPTRQSFNNVSLFDKIDNFEEPPNNIKQTTFNRIHSESIEKNKFSSMKQVQIQNQKTQNVQFQQQPSKSQGVNMMPNYIANPSNTQLEKLQTKIRSVKPDFDYELVGKYNQNYQFDQEFFKYQLAWMDNFDKVRIFKKFFPANNINKVIQSLKQIQQQRRKNKKMTQKFKRRSNVMLEFDSNQNQLVQHKQNQKPVIFEYVAKKPTFLSYGVSMRNLNQFPKSFS